MTNLVWSKATDMTVMQGLRACLWATAASRGTEDAADSIRPFRGRTRPLPRAVSCHFGRGVLCAVFSVDISIYINVLITMNLSIGSLW